MEAKVPLRVLAFDPGETTGIAFVQEQETVWSMAASYDAFQDPNFFSCLVKMTKVTTYIVVELPPTSGKFYNKKQTEVFVAIKGWFTTAGYKVEIISPGMWKGLVQRSKLSATHQQDATDMGMWLSRKLMKDQS